MPQFEINGEEFVEFQMLAYVLEMKALLFMFIAVVLVSKNLAPVQTHLATVSWNG